MYRLTKNAKPVAKEHEKLRIDELTKTQYGEIHCAPITK